MYKKFSFKFKLNIYYFSSAFSSLLIFFSNLKKQKDYEKSHRLKIKIQIIN